MYLPDTYLHICSFDPYTKLFDTCSTLYKLKKDFYKYNLSYSKVQDVSFLQYMHIINLNGTNVSDLTTLKNVKQLSLQYCCNQITKNNPVEQPEDTENNYVDRVIFTFDMRQMKQLSNLTHLNLSYCTNLDDLTPISHVRSINLSYSDVCDVTPLAGTHILSLKRCMHVKNIDALAHVHELDLSYTNITDISCLICVNKLSVYGCDIKTNMNFTGEIHGLIKQHAMTSFQCVDTSLSIELKLRNLEVHANILNDDDDDSMPGYDVPGVTFI